MEPRAGHGGRGTCGTQGSRRSNGRGDGGRGQGARRDRGSKAVDYPAIEVSIEEAAARIGGAGHEAISSRSTFDRPSVIIGGPRFARVGRSEATYYTMAGPVMVGAVAPTREWTTQREGGRSGDLAGWGGCGRLAPTDRERDGPPGPAGHFARGRGECSPTGASTYSCSKFQRVPHAVGELYVPAHGDIEDALIEQYQVPERARQCQRLARPGERSDGGTVSPPGGPTPGDL